MHRYLFSVIFILLLSGCSDKKNIYNQELIDTFISSCAAGGSVNELKCGCMIDLIQYDLTEKEYIEMETKFILSRNASEEFVEVLTNARVQCLTSNLKS